MLRLAHNSQYAYRLLEARSSQSVIGGSTTAAFRLYRRSARCHHSGTRHYSRLAE
jgi:hypothetical protein